MKKLTAILLTLTLIFSFTACGETQPATETTNNAENNSATESTQVDEIRTVRCDFVGGNSDGTYYIAEINENGDTVKNTRYNKDGTINYYFTNEFYNPGKAKIKKTYSADGTLSSYVEFEYDNEKRIKETSYKADGTSDYSTNIEYDTNGNVVKTASYFADNTIRFIQTSKYDTNGYCVEMEEETSYGKGRLVYEYDSIGNCIKETIYDGDKVSSIVEYVYDGNGNKTSIKQYLSSGTLLQHIEYEYNEFGEVVKQIDKTVK